MALERSGRGVFGLVEAAADYVVFGRSLIATSLDGDVGELHVFVVFVFGVQDALEIWWADVALGKETEIFSAFGDAGGCVHRAWRVVCARGDDHACLFWCKARLFVRFADLGFEWHFDIGGVR